MVRTQTAVDTALRVTVIVIGVAVAGYLAFSLLLLHALQEPYPFLNVQNESGRPLLIERPDVVPSPDASDLSVLAWRATSGLDTSSYECDKKQLVARDLHGTVVSRRTGVCEGDTWTITAEGMPAAPRHQPLPAGSDHVEARLVLVTSRADPWSCGGGLCRRPCTGPPQRAVRRASACTAPSSRVRT